MSASPRARRPAAPVPARALEDIAADDGVLEDEVTLEAVALGGTVPPHLFARFVTIAESRVTATLAGARLPDATLRDCVLDAPDLANLRAERLALHRSEVRDARLTGATLAEASLRDATLTGCRANLVSLSEARIERVVFAECDLREATFDQARLHDVRFERCALDGASFARATLSRVELVGCALERVRSVADLRGAAMPFEDMLENAAALAAAAGIRVLDESIDESGVGPWS